MKSRRYLSIDLYKLLFTYLIVLHHTNMFSQFIVRGYIVVEFFFMVSGFLFYRSYRVNYELSIYEFIKKRVIRLYPGYFLSYVLIYFWGRVTRYDFLINNNYSKILELLLLQGIGIPNVKTMNYPLWYLSVMLWGEILLYILIKKLGDRRFNYVGIVMIVLIVCRMLSSSTKIEQWGYWNQVFYAPFWRGMLDMLIGVYAFKLINRLHINKEDKALLSILEILLLVVFIFLLFSHKDYDYVAAAMLVSLLIVSACSESIVDRIASLHVVKSLSKHEYTIYLNQVVFIRSVWFIGNRYKLNTTVRTIMIVVSLTLFSIILDFLIDQCKAYSCTLAKGKR